jgi:CelD/BcsL family acetyltransferase involved in cellulose biosynthesis
MYQSARLIEPRWKDVGVTLFASIVDDACARGLIEVDFLRGEEEWKGRFTTQRREMFRLVAGKGVMGGLGRTGTAATFYASQAAVRGVRFGRSMASRWNAKSRDRSSTGGGAPSGTSESAVDDS